MALCLMYLRILHAWQHFYQDKYYIVVWLLVAVQLVVRVVVPHEHQMALSNFLAAITGQHSRHTIVGCAAHVAYHGTLTPKTLLNSSQVSYVAHA